MSFTGYYSPFIVVDEERSPKILDKDKWEEWCEANETIADQASVGKVEEGDYPKKQYKTLRGFETWGEADEQ